MKMPEKHDLLYAILAARREHRGEILRLQWRTFAADIMAVRLHKNSNRRNGVRHCRPDSFRDYKLWTETQSRLYNERVYRLHRY